MNWYDYLLIIFILEFITELAFFLRMLKKENATYLINFSWNIDAI